MMPSVRTVCAMLISAALFGIASCGKEKTVQAPPPPEVTVSHPLQKEITDYAIFTGQTAAVESADVRARVEGWLEKIHFEPGSKVKEDDLLFEIDPRPFQAQVDQYQALLEAKKADLALAKTNLDRAGQLLETASISQLQYDESKAKALVAQAQVGIAQANLEKALLDLAYTKVVAPIGGTVSRNYVDRGNLVGAGEKTLLTKVVDTSHVYFYFDVSERDYLRFQRMFDESTRDERTGGARAQLQLADESGYPHEGTVDFAEPELDPGTGTLQARAVFDNDDGLLTSGLFGRVRIPIRTRDALLVPDLAIGMTQAGRYVMVVNKENIAEQRLVQPGELVGTLRVIEKGLSTDDWVVVNAIQRAQPGRKVRTKETQISADAAGEKKQETSDSETAETRETPPEKPTETGGKPDADTSPPSE